MFGRVRASPSPVEYLELERLPSKMLKDVSLSIYEATLMKLKQGSRKRIESLPDEMAAEAMSDHDNLSSSSGDKLPRLQRGGDAPISDGDSSNSTVEQGTSMSIMYLFDRYKKSSCHLEAKGPQNGEEMDTEEGSLTEGSTISSDGESAGF